jgi:type II secretory pathway component PulF
MAQVKLDTLVNFTTQFSSMINANIPLMKILINLEKDVLDIKFAKILADIRSDVEKGYDFANSLKKHPEAFDTIYVNMVNAGMESGRLNTVLNQLSIYLTKASQTANKIKSALSYPKFMGIAMVLIMSLMLIKVIPMFEKMFNNSKQELPQLTQIIIYLSDVLRNNLFLIIIFIIVSYLSFKIYTKTTNGKMTIDKLKISLPYIGTLNKKSSISKFIRTLGVLTISDIPILKAIKLSKSSSANVLIEEKIEEITLMIEKGYGIAEAFKKTDIFPDIIIQMIGSGEESGQLGELLISSANYYDDQIDNELKSTIGLINPIMTVFMGLFIATLMLAIFMPIFQMGDMY